MWSCSVPGMQTPKTENGRSSRRSPGAMRALLVGTATTLAVLATVTADAQNAGQEEDPFAGVEEMIVTGGNAAALLAPTSTAAITFGAAELDSYNVEDLGDVAAYVPNLEIRTQNATNASFFIRGVGLQDFGANSSSSVPIFQDGVPRNPSATQLAGLFDVGNLGVLKGPQGSGNYRNASAGVIKVEAVKPTPEFTGFAQVNLSKIVSVDARDANRYEFEAATSAPIFDDWISARISARYKHENPFWENGCANRIPIEDRPVQIAGANQPSVGLCGDTVSAGDRSSVDPFLPSYIGEVDDFAFRGQIRFVPPETPLDLTLRFETSQLNRDSTAGQHIGTGFRAREVGGSDSAGYQEPDNAARQADFEAFFRSTRPGLTNPQYAALALAEVGREILKRPLDQRPYRGDLDSPGRTILETYVASTTAVLDLEDFDVELNAGYIDYRKSERRDTDLSPNKRFPSTGNDQAWEVYGDLTFTGDMIGDIPLSWSTGAYGMIEQVEAKQRQLVFETARNLDYQQEIYSFGVFAEGRYEFLEAFTLAAGARYNWERKDFEVDELSLPANPFPGFVFPPLLQQSRNQRTWDAFTGFAEIRYDFTEEVGSYMKYSRGFKAGQFNPSRPQDTRDPDIGWADPERIDAVEWGVDFGAWAGRINGSAALFYYNYQNYQVFRLTTTGAGVFRAIESARKARNYGAELELTVSPLEGFVPQAIEGLRINFRFGWLETNYVEFTVAEQRPLPGGNVGVSIDYSGNALISAPNLQIATTFTWPFDLGRLGTITPQYDFTWTDDTPFDPNNGRGELDVTGASKLRPYLIGNRAFVLHNVRLSWRPAGDTGMSIAGWCRNVTDERYKDFSVDISSFSGQILNFVADPRTCGAEARFSW